MKKCIRHYWYQIQFYLVVAGFSLILLTFSSCKKSNDQLSSAVNKAAEDAAKAAGIAITNWAITNGVNWQTNSQISNAVETFPGAVRMAITNEVFVETGLAGVVLNQLREQGRLPGVSKDEHGKLTSDTVQLVISNNAVVMVYPASRTLRLVKTGETTTNNYTLVKRTKGAEWQLQRAWQTDSNGQIIKEWPVQ